MGTGAQETVWLGDLRDSHSIHLRNQDLGEKGEDDSKKLSTHCAHIPLWAATPNGERQWLRWKQMKDA